MGQKKRAMENAVDCVLDNINKYGIKYLNAQDKKVLRGESFNVASDTVQSAIIKLIKYNLVSPDDILLEKSEIRINRLKGKKLSFFTKGYLTIQVGTCAFNILTVTAHDQNTKRDKRNRITTFTYIKDRWENKGLDVEFENIPLEYMDKLEIF